jgi:hypothetical protein
MYWTSIIDPSRRNARLFIAAACLACWLPAAAQSSYGPAKRQGIHDLINEKQQVIDKYDGATDGRFETGSRRDNEKAAEAYFTLIDLLQQNIESAKQGDLEKYNDLVGVYNLIANISERSVQYVNYHYVNIHNAYGIIAYKSLGSLDMFLYRHMLPSINNIVLFKDEAIAESFLKDAAGQYPVELLKAFSTFQKEHYAQAVLEHTVRVAPNTVKKYFPVSSFINTLLVNSEDPVVLLVLDIYRHYGTESKAYFFLDKVAALPEKKGYYSYLWPDSWLYLDELIDIRKKPGPLGEFSLDQELELQALKYVRAINDMHLLKDDRERFASVDSMDAEQLYTLITYSAEEIFTSTYNGIFSRLLHGIQRDSVDGFEFLESMNFSRFRTFIKLAAGYNTLNDFLATMSAGDRDRLFRKFVKGLGDNLNDLDEAVDVADTFGSLEDSVQLQNFLDYLAEDFEVQRQELNIYGKTIYSLLISLIGEKIEISEEISEMIGTMELPSLDRVDIADLQDAEKMNIQQHFFFDDDDGLLSFASFIANYQQSSNWKIDYHPHYVVIESRYGHPVKIYANKPLYEREGQQEIRELFDSSGIAPSVVVHRGHSYYVHITIDNVQPETRMVFLGSCGGYHNLSQVIDRSPSVHIISSKQIGTIYVNNPLLFAISDKIRRGEDIVWSDIWATVGKWLQTDSEATGKFRDYIPPHKNLGAIFLQAYYELTG